MKQITPALLLPVLGLFFAACDSHDFEATKHLHEGHGTHSTHDDGHAADGEGDHGAEGESHEDAHGDSHGKKDGHDKAAADHGEDHKDAGEGHDTKADANGHDEPEAKKRPRVVPEK